MGVDALSVVAKAIGYIALLQGAGVALFLAAFGPLLDHSIVSIRRLGVASALTAILALLAFHLMEAARMTGEFSGVVDPVFQARVLASPLGPATALRMLGATLIALGLSRASRERALLALMGAAMATASFLLIGHSVTNQPRWALVPLLEFHLLVVAFWFGSIVPLGLGARRETPTIAHAVVERFSAVAAVLVPAMAAAGLGMAWILTEGKYSWADPYCASLTGKVALLSIALILAALNRWRFGPALGTGSSQAVRWFSWSLAAEYVVLVAIIVLTAAMTNLFSPAH